MRANCHHSHFQPGSATGCQVSKSWPTSHTSSKLSCAAAVKGSHTKVSSAARPTPGLVSECFDHPITIERNGGRWTARAS